MGQSFEAAGESSDPLEIRLSVTCGDQSFFKCLGVTRVIVDEKYIVVCIAHCKRRLKSVGHSNCQSINEAHPVPTLWAALMLTESPSVTTDTNASVHFRFVLTLTAYVGAEIFCALGCSHLASNMPFF